MNDFRVQVASIMAGTAPDPSVIPPVDGADRPTLRRGARGAPVNEAQRELGIDMTGVFDAEMEATVRQYQRENALVPDCILGPRSWATLLG